MRAVTWPSALSLFMLFAASSGPASAGEQLVLASGRAGTPMYMAGVGLSSLVKFELLPTEKIDLQAVASAGALDNVRQLQSGDAELAILPSPIGHAARLGIGSFAGDPPDTGFRAIATLWRDALHLVVREDDVATGTIEDLSKLKDRKLFLGEVASGMVDANRLLLSDLGLDADRHFKLSTVDDGDGISAIKRGEVDAFSATARPPVTMFEDVFKDPASGLRLLDINEGQMIKANGNHWLWTPYVIPAATYPGQDEDVWTIALSNLLVVRADVDPEIVHAITKSIFENLAYLKRVDPLMADLSLETALAGMAMPLHPGALLYYGEAGLITMPANEVAGPEVTPVREESQQPAVMPERYSPQRHHPESSPPESYPDADVAGEWRPSGVGGPLLRTEPADQAAPEPAGVREKPASNWRRRATL